MGFLIGGGGNIGMGKDLKKQQLMAVVKGLSINEY